MSCTLLHMSSLFYVKETLPGCPNLSFITTADNQSITRMIWSPSQIKNHNCLVEVMLLIVLSPDPNMQAERKSIQQELDLENGCITLEMKKPKLKALLQAWKMWRNKGALHKLEHPEEAAHYIEGQIEKFDKITHHEKE